jgi:hypothetical protein
MFHVKYHLVEPVSKRFSLFKVKKGKNFNHLWVPFFPFNIRCWTFDVRCSFFQFLPHKNNLPLMMQPSGLRKFRTWCQTGGFDDWTHFFFPFDGHNMNTVDTFNFT